MRSLGFSLFGMPGAPGANDRLKLDQARALAGRIVDEVNRVLTDRVAPYREALRAAGYTPFAELGLWEPRRCVASLPARPRRSQPRRTLLHRFVQP